MSIGDLASGGANVIRRAVCRRNDARYTHSLAGLRVLGLVRAERDEHGRKSVRECGRQRIETSM